MAFSFARARISDLIIVTPQVYMDNRGCFLEVYKQSEFKANGIEESFCQENRSISKKGVLRGMHYQTGLYAQGKLVTVVHGEILDVAVDIRKESPTYLKWESIILNADNKKLFYIPPGFAHGFLSLSDDTEVIYKCTKEYNKNAESGFRFDDPIVAIDWGIKNPILSDVDAARPFANDIV